MIPLFPCEEVTASARVPQVEVALSFCILCLDVKPVITRWKEWGYWRPDWGLIFSSGEWRFQGVRSEQGADVFCDCVLQLQTGVTVVQSEGYAALMSGVSATVARGLFYGGET